MRGAGRLAVAGLASWAAIAVAETMPDLLGFLPESSAKERAVEARLLTMAAPERCEVHHRELTRSPHTAGTAGAERVVAYVADRFREYGLETEVVSYDVLLASPRSVEVDLIAPRPARLATREDAIPEDPSTSDASASGPWHAYAKSGEVTADVVYVNYGRAEDYDTLAGLGIEVRGRIALARSFKGYRGGKSLEAERHGVAALLTYSDPAEDGYVQGDVHPAGPWGNDTHVQRGGNVYDFIVPGDPLTPGWASTPGARRIPEADSAILPKIPSAPLSFRDARQILEELRGPVRPSLDWQGGGPFAYHVGPGPARLRMKVDVPRETRTIRNVIGRIRGGDPDPRVAEQVVLLSNHHDAWTFGGVDPSSGTATTLELARVLGQLAREGVRPRRTLVFGVWDAEEFTLTGSTEWGEEHREALSRTAVACLNVDASTSGDRLAASASPPLRPLLYEAARSVPDPKGRGTVYDVWRAGAGENVRSYGVVAGERTADPPVAILGSGSDYTVFFNHIGIPSADLVFDGPYGVYHSVYDTHEWMRRHGDPGFLYHAAMARLWGVLALRLANADVLPLDYRLYGREVLTYLDDLERVAREKKVSLDLEPARAAARTLRDTGLASAGSLDPSGRARTNAGLLAAERALLAEPGIPDRPWFKHLVYAPLPTYQAETLPGVREAVVAGDADRARAQATVLAEALRRASAALAR
jgi:N-acetylated-alpha-linked acidic dipeptidase